MSVAKLIPTAAQSATIDLSPPRRRVLPDAVRIRITMRAGTGVFYRQRPVDGRDAPPGHDLNHGEVHLVDLVFARGLVARKQAVLIDNNDVEHAIWPGHVLPVTAAEVQAAEESATARRDS